MSETQLSKIQQIKKLISREYAKTASRKLIVMVGGSISFLLIFWSVFSLLENWFYLEPAVKILLWVGFFVSLSVGFFKLQKILHISSFTDFYTDFSKKKNMANVRHALDLLENPRNQNAGFVQQAIDQNLQNTELSEIQSRTDEYVKSGPNYFWFRSSLLALVFAVLFSAFSISVTDGTTQRMLSFWKTFDKPNPFEFVVTPGNDTIEQGARVRIQIEFENIAVPEQVSILQKTDIESSFRTRPMTQTDQSTWISESIEVFNDMTYYFRMDGYNSERYEVEVQLIPRFKDLVVTAKPPSYTGLENQKFTYPFNRIEAYAGTQITITGTPNKEITTPELFRHRSADTLSLEQDETKWTTQFTVEKTDSLTFGFEDQYGLTNRNPFNFRLIALEDQYPYVRIIQPDREKTGMNIDELNITYDLEDDFGFSSVVLRYELLKAFTDNPIKGQVRLDTPRERNTIARYNWDLSALGLASMDELTYWIEVSDNDAINGYKTSRSEKNILRIQSLADYLFEQEEREQEIASSMEDAQDKYQRMQDQYERLREQIRDTPDDEWEQSQTIDEIEKQRKEIEEQVEELQKAFEELRKEMQNDQTLSEETQQRYDELQELMKQIDDPEILKMLQEMQENLGKMDQTQMREALEQLEFNEDRYRERLERTVELFKQLKLNSDLDKATQVLEELRQREEQLSKMEEYGDQEIEQQQKIKDELDRLQEQMDKLPENAPKRQQQNVDELNKQLQEQLEQTKEQLDENMQEMRDGGSQEQIQQQQQQIMQQMQNMSSQISESREMMNQDQIQVNILALQNILQTIILLSEEQEEILNLTSGLQDRSAAFVELARRERNALQNFNAVADSLFEVSKEIPQFTNRINTRRGEVQKTMNQAVNAMIERERNNSTNAQRLSMAGLNEIGTLLADLIDQLQDQEGGGGGGDGMSMQQMMEQMQNMGEQQQQLNQQIQDFINDMQGDRLSQDNMERLDQMARQQNQIREQLRNLQRSGGLDPGDQALSELERLAEEMEDAINDMRGGSVDQLMVQRQQNILSRMLETERSLQERDEDEERREGEAPSDYDISRAPEFTMEELQQKIRTGLQDPNQTRFNEDYQRLIERYFELLREQNNRQSQQSQ